MAGEARTAESWQITAGDVEEIALGAGVLGSGGGGSTYLGSLLVQRVLGAGQTIAIAPPASLAAGALVIAVAQVGAPIVFAERLARGTEAGLACRALEEHLGERAAAVLCDEIGGVNSMTPLLAVAQLGVPVLDADAIGRAFPELSMNTLSIYGAPPAPCVFCDDEGNVSIFPRTRDAAATERLGRALTIAMGGVAYLARPAPRDAALRQALIDGSYSRARAIGRALRRAYSAQSLPEIDLAPVHGRVLLHGLVVMVDRRPAPGPMHGVALVEGHRPGQLDSLRIEFQNEFLLARHDDQVVAVTPDVISLIDDETGEPISAEAVEVGRRVVVLGLATDAKLTTPQALQRVGPAAFGYDVAYRPLR